MTRVIGIDLGTTNCCVAIFDAGAPRVIPNKGGYKTTPSVIGIAADGRVHVGQPAQRQATTNAQHTAYAVKRLIGRAFQSEEVQHARSHVSYPIVSGPGGDPRIVLRSREYSCPEISAFLLTEMRVVAEEHLGEPVEKAVVTVPAYFNDSQRQAVRDAGTIAGLEVVRIINEPTAAAIAYGFGHDKDRTVAVYDLGGGTFDVSIVRCTTDGNFRVLATTGDSFLGGEDFDERLMRWLLDGFEGEHGITVRDQPMVIQRVRDAASKAKCDLSAVPRTEIQLPFLVNGPSGPLSMHYEVTREALEGLTWDLVQRTIDICGHALQTMNADISTIDEVVLVGGMTRMPLVQARVAELFGKPPSKGVHPDEAVAVGAALQGAAFADQISEINLEDVTSQAIGVGLAGDKFGVLIPANSRVPCKVTRKLTTSRENQSSLRVRVLQGDSMKASENELLHEFDITGLRPGAAGSVTLEVGFAIDAEGLFHATAVDQGTGKSIQVEVRGDSGLAADEVERLSKEHQGKVEERRQHDVLEGMRQSVETLILEMAQLCAKLDAAGFGHRPMVNSYSDRVAQLRSVIGSFSRSDLAETLLELEDGKGQLEVLATTLRR